MDAYNYIDAAGRDDEAQNAHDPGDGGDVDPRGGDAEGTTTVGPGGGGAGL